MQNQAQMFYRASRDIGAIRLAILQPNVAFFLGRHLVQRHEGKANIRVNFPEQGELHGL